MGFQPYLIGIAGPSCSGKSELSYYLARQFSSCTVLGLDHYYRNLADLPLDLRHTHNFDVPEALDHELIIEQVHQLAAGRAIARPVYHFATHSRGEEIEIVEPAEVIIIEGLFALHWDDLRVLFDSTVFVETDDAVCLSRRQARDTRERGRTPESIIEQYSSTVRPMCRKHILPTQQFADVTVNGEDHLRDSAQAVRAHMEVRRSAGAVALN